MMWGLDFLGLPRYSDLAIREFPNGWALGCFGNTFGDSFPVVRELVLAGRTPHVRVHLLWSDTHSFSLQDVQKAIEESSRYNRLARNNKNVVIELSPFCEHNLPNPDQWLDMVAEKAPHCRIVNTPYKGAVSRKYKNEVHGPSSRPRGPYNYSYDGSSCVDSDVEAKKKQHARAEVHFFWVPQFNLRKNTNDKTPRPERKAVPTSGLIDSVIYLHNPAGSGIGVPRNFLWKSHADQHEAPIPEPRAHKPVLICPVQAERFELLADNGQVIRTAPYYGKFSDGRHRYYFGDYGYQLAEKAVRIQGHPVVHLRANGRLFGKVNPAFRAGDFRE